MLETFKIFGYGTFITRKMYKDKRNVEVAYLPDYFRVFRPQLDWFPYIIHKDEIKNVEINVNPGFWGLIFEVNSEKLVNLDRYEGSGVLYKRIYINCFLKDGKKEKTFIYYPKDEIIRDYNLVSFISFGDLWREKIIIEFPEIVIEFPELKLDSMLKKV